MEWIKKTIPFLLVLLTIIGYFGFSYTFERTHHFELFVAFSLLFVAYLLLVVFFSKIKFQFYLLFFTGLLVRLLFLLTPPHLSDDYFRFTWDGELSKDGISVFSFQPRHYQEGLKDRPGLIPKYEQLSNAKTDEFPNGMNSKQYFSIYPTFNQGVYWLSSYFGASNSGNLVIMRLLLILAEIASFFALRQLLISENKSRHWVHLYWLNPLVIIELTGNLHFDGFAITFMLLALLYLTKKQWLPSILSISLAIVTKLNPIFFFAAIFEQMRWRKFVLYGLTSLVLVVLLLSLILDADTFFNFAKSFGLYFAWFEFNTGLYAFFREVIYAASGVDVSSKLSIIFPIVTILLFLKITFFSPKLKVAEKILLLYFIYFAFSPIVHPWYATILIPFGILAGRLYPLVWSFLIFFTYFAYQSKGFSQPHIIVFVEYLILYVCFYFEMKTKRLEGIKQRLFSV